MPVEKHSSYSHVSS